MFCFKGNKLYYRDTLIMYIVKDYVIIGDAKFNFGISCKRDSEPYLSIYCFSYESQIPIYNRLNELMDVTTEGEISDDLYEYVLYLYEFVCYFNGLVLETIFDFEPSYTLSKPLITTEGERYIKVENNVIQFCEL